MDTYKGRDNPINVLVVEDSHVIQMLLVHLLNSDPQIRVIGVASNGRDAVEFMASHQPDVILMDIDMPVMDGFEATRRIMESRPTPIVICSASRSPREMSTFRLMEVGAVALVEKPVGKDHSDFEAMASRLLQTVKLMSEVKVVRRWPRNKVGVSSAVAQQRDCGDARSLIGIGASTGGPPVLQTIFAALPKDFPAPILVVQHIAAGFLDGLVEWLNQTTGLTVHVAAHDVRPLPGHVYFAPDGFHMGLGAGGAIELRRSPPTNGVRPAVSQLFASLASRCGPNATGVLLTGMGKDGASELKLIRDRGGLTIAQDKESSIVHGMPGEAIALGAASHVLAPDRIAAALVSHHAQRTQEGTATP